MVAQMRVRPLQPGIPIPFVAIGWMIGNEEAVPHQLNRRSVTRRNEPAVACEAAEEMVIEVPAKVAIAREDDVGLKIRRQPVRRVSEQKNRMTRRDRFNFHFAQEQGRFACCRASDDAGAIEIQAAREHARQVHPVLAGSAVHERCEVAHHLDVTSRSGG